MVHVVRKVRLAYVRRPYIQDCLGVLKSDSQFFPVGHQKRAEKKPPCLHYLGSEVIFHRPFYNAN